MMLLFYVNITIADIYIIQFMLKILHQDEHIIAINKPPGLVVHPSRMAANATESAMQILRDQIDAWVYPVHRLDRKTSGVLIFGLNKEIQAALSKSFQEAQMTKKYIAIVRGYTDAEGLIDYALENPNGKIQDAVTKYKTLKQTEIPLAHGKHSSSRYSLVELYPKTGRYHQLRKHMAHIFHPIIGDRPHGCNKQNRLFKKEFALIEMMLHACELRFVHPKSKKEIHLNAPPFPEFVRVNKILLLD